MLDLGEEPLTPVVPDLPDIPDLSSGATAAPTMPDSVSSPTLTSSSHTPVSIRTSSEPTAPATATSAVAGVPAAASSFRVPPLTTEPEAATQEISAAHARAYANDTPRPTGAAAAERPPQIPLAPVKRMQARFNPLADGLVYLVVFLGGMVGTAMRYGLSLLIPGPAASEGFFSSFHTATFVANMIACFLFAALTQYISQASWLLKRVRQLTSRGVGMGMCGGFSTLSAMVIEELTSIRGAQIGGFVFYALASFAGGLVVAAFGVKLGLALAQRRQDAVVDLAVSHAGDETVPVSAPPTGDFGQPLGSDTATPPALEPAPITDEVPMVSNPAKGVAVEASDIMGEETL